MVIQNITLIPPSPAQPHRKDGSLRLEADEASNTGEHHWLTLLCKFNDVADEPDAPAFFENMYGGANAGLNHYWYEVSYGKLSLVGGVAPQWVTLQGNYSDYVTADFTNTQKLLQDCAAAADDLVDFSNGGRNGYDGLILAFNSSLPALGYGGGLTATLQGVEKSWRVAFLSPSGYSNEAVVAHEMGHAYGLPHSDNGDHDRDPYDNPWDVMSSTTRYVRRDAVRGNLGKHTNAYHKLQLGWFDEEEILEVRDPGIYTVTVDAMAVPATVNYRAVRIPRYGTPDVYMIEVRKRLGRYDGHLPGDAVIIYSVDRYRYVGGWLLPSWTRDTDIPPAGFGDNEGTMFRVGETYVDVSNHVAISVDAETPDGFVLTIDTSAMPTWVPCPITDIALESQAAIDDFRDSVGECETVEGDLRIGTSTNIKAAIQDLRGLTGIRFVHGILSISSTRTLTDLDGLQNLTGAGGLSVLLNADLTSLRGLAGVQDLGSLSIGANPALTEIASLRKVRTQLSGLDVNDNYLLSSLEGLENIPGVQFSVRVENNLGLSECSALRTLFDYADDYAHGPGPALGSRIPDVGGSITIRNNGSGCNSVEDIARAPSPAALLSGSWYDPERSGAGFMFHSVREDLAVGYFYGYDKQGKRFWLIGTYEGPIDWDLPLDFEALEVTGGTFEHFDPQSIKKRPWGYFRLSQDNCDLSVVSLEGQFEGDEVIDASLMGLQRLAPLSGIDCAGNSVPVESDGITGSWYDPALDGQGFSIHKINDQRGVVYFYGFNRDGDRLWLIGTWEGGLAFGEAVTIDMMQASGGQFEFFDPDDIVRESWGTLQLQLDSCTSGSARLSGLDGVQEFNLQLLAGTHGLGCAIRFD
jgi:M6 family metalloprotease-like protein